MLGAAYELLDERSADRLEEELFGGVQTAYGRAQRTHADVRRALRARRGGRSSSRRPASGSRDVRRSWSARARRSTRPTTSLVELQDSMLPVEVGDPELRAGLAEVRELVGELRASARQFMRTFGR